MTSQLDYSRIIHGVICANGYQRLVLVFAAVCSSVLILILIMSIRNDNSAAVAGEQRYEQNLDPQSDDDASLPANNVGVRPRRQQKPIKDANHHIMHHQVTIL